MLDGRLKKVRARMRAHGLEQLVITRPQAIYYLTGEWVEPHDRLDALIVTHDACRILCYVLAVIRPADCEVTVYSDTGETVERLAALLDSVPTGVDGWCHSRFLLPLQQRRPDLRLTVDACVDEARMLKEPEEVERLRNASVITDRVFEDAFSRLREGMTELELGDVFSDCFARQGVGRFVGTPMVCFGAGSAEPHHTPGEARLRRGDTVCVDTGKRVDGYYSDMTRTVFFREVSAEQRDVYHAVLQANLAALDAIRPGVPIGEIHRAACRVLEAAGYGAYYPHRTSHGIGIDYHEEPFDLETRVLPVEPGMCFSVEPGVYLPGRFGVRIEDLVVVTETGYSLLNHAPKELRVI